MKKKITSLLLAACMLVGLVPAWNLSASAADSSNEAALVADTVAGTPASGTCGDNLSWSFSSDGTLTITGTGEMDEYTDHAAPWDSFNHAITSINIENGVTSIGDWAFDDFVNLTSVTIPDSVTSIGDKAFVSCSNLTSVSIPDSVTKIGDYAFYDCSKLYSVIIPDSVTSIGARAFSDCTRLTNVTIPSSVTELLVEVFSNCTSLRSITIPDSVTTIQMGAFGHCSNLTSILIPNSVTSIESSAFYSCTNLSSVAISNSVTSIASGAFSNCDKLTDVFFDGSKEEWSKIEIGSDNDSLLNAIIHYNSSLLAIGTCGKNLKFTLSTDGTLTITGTGEMDDFYDYNYEVPWNAFYDSIKSVKIENGVTNIGDLAFSTCANLSSVTIPDSVTSIGNYAFSNCTSLSSITIPDSVTDIGNFAFYHCTSLSSVTIPDSVTSIGSRTFRGCTNLAYVNIPNSVTSIGSWAFSKCDKLTDIFFDGSKEEWSKIEIGSDNDSLLNATIHYKDQDVSPFVDIQNPKDFFYAPVLWAASNSITYGVDDTHFAPHQSCTRSQVVAFLWRAMDCPEPTTTECPFVDVKPSDFFYKAMLWAVENKIAYGVDSTHFDPSATVTRADFVTFLWRAQNRPGSTKSSFVDIPANSYYTTAINWAAENKVAYGTDDTHFSPTFPCTRGQVVTFLYRNLA